LTTKFFDVAKFIVLSLLTSCKILFPNVGLKIGLGYLRLAQSGSPTDRCSVLLVPLLPIDGAEPDPSGCAV
jgi:hypothetical protein